VTQPVRIPADVDREDKILAGLTARQVAVLAVTGILLYSGWTLTRPILPLAAFLALAIPLVITVAALVMLRRDGMSLDRLLLAAIRQRLAPRRLITSPTSATPEMPDWLAPLAAPDPKPLGGLELPAQAVNEAGIVDLGREGLALIAAASTVNFSLRTPTEQDGIVAAFGRYLHSLTAPVQILIRAQRLDLSGQITELRERAGHLPHPALEAAAHDHADYLTHLARHTELLRRQILLVLREPLAPSLTTRTGGLPRSRSRPDNTDPSSPQRRAAQSRLIRRVTEATDLLSAAGITLTALDAAQATAVLAATCQPDSPIPPAAELADPDEVITTPPDTEDWS